MAFFDLRFGFLVKNCIYGQILVKNHENPVKLIKKSDLFTNLNVGLCREKGEKRKIGKIKTDEFGRVRTNSDEFGRVLSGIRKTSKTKKTVF